MRSAAAPTVGDLEDFGAADAALAGGKGANLGELLRAGFPVPPGFVITTAAYRRLLAETGLGALIADLPPAAAEGEAVRGAFAAAGVPDALRSAILAAYHRFGAGPVAVRSSATAEDLPGAAFAGQQDTFLDVDGDAALLDAVSRCWASLFTDRAMSYRRRQGIHPDEVAIAVVVQHMVRAEAAGVMFSADPVSGLRGRVVIDAAAGTGEAVVSGSVTPEHFVLDARDRILERGVMPALTDARLRELAALCRAAAAQFGPPQDVEWALAGERLQVLQARPMTALPPEPLRLNRFQKTMGPFFVEMFQQRPYPLDVSGWLQVGIEDMLVRMAASVGVRTPKLADLLPEEDGVVVRLVPPVPRPTLKTLAAPVSVARRARRFRVSRWTEDPRFADFKRNVAELEAQDVGLLAWQELLGFGCRAMETAGAIADLRVSYLPGAFLPQLGLRPMLLALGKRRLAPALVAGARTRTSDANRELERLAALARSTPGLREAFGVLTPAELLRRLPAEQQFGAFDAALHSFLAEYGHRETASVVLSSAPTWADAPEVVLDLVRVLLGSPVATADQTGHALRELLDHPALRNRLLRRYVLAAVEASKAGMAFREDTHFYLTKVLPPLRRAWLEAGQRLWAAGVLEAPEEVFHLRLAELQGIANAGALSGEEVRRLRRTVRARAVKREQLASVPLLDPAALFPAALFPAGSAAGPALLTGTPASRGTATGPARIVHGTGEFGRLRSGEVLVCPYTNPSWTPLFQRAAAVVVDTGGIGSHTAIVAREYGIPAVMGTGNGTSKLRDGQQVTVDGGRGTITLAER